MIIEKQVKVAKEVDDVVQLVVKLVKSLKEQKDMAAAAATCIPDLLVAVDGISEVDDEWKQDKAAVINSALYAGSELLSALLSKPV